MPLACEKTPARAAAPRRVHTPSTRGARPKASASPAAVLPASSTAGRVAPMSTPSGPSHGAPLCDQLARCGGGCGGARHGAAPPRVRASPRCSPHAPAMARRCGMSRNAGEASAQTACARPTARSGKPMGHRRAAAPTAGRAAQSRRPHCRCRWHTARQLGRRVRGPSRGPAPCRHAAATQQRARPRRAGPPTAPARRACDAARRSRSCRRAVQLVGHACVRTRVRWWWWWHTHTHTHTHEHAWGWLCSIQQVTAVSIFSRCTALITNLATSFRSSGPEWKRGSHMAHVVS